MKIVQPKFIVGIGGSAGALNAYKALLDAMPHDTGMAFVIISHMNPTAHSQLAQILSRHTKMSVIVASEAMPILANHVYVIPPDADLTMVNYRFKVISPRSGGHKQVDVFFISLAEAMGARAVGIVLSGYDGVTVLRAASTSRPTEEAPLPKTCLPKLNSCRSVLRQQVVLISFYHLIKFQKS